MTNNLDNLLAKPSAADQLRQRIANEGPSLLDSGAGNTGNTGNMGDSGGPAGNPAEQSLLSTDGQQAPQQTAPPPQRDPMFSDQPSTQEMPDQSGVPPATEQENKQARIFMTNIRNTLYDTMADQVAVRLKRGRENMTQAVGDLAAELMYNETASAQMAETPLSQNIMIELGSNIVEELYTIADALGLWQPGDDTTAQKDQSTSLNYAAQKFVHMAGPSNMVDVGQLQRASEDIKGGVYDAPAQAPEPQPEQIAGV